ncbi:alpha/beta hydrolase [Portibacter lacus]|uniref:Alpha/beta hydrolase n=2 Tax=Portibacter lacus TaxID=1099794 RepID=A0AA37SSW5_9BACT|nr:alpha/beta hydrolase [Portibacter lacus]
MTKARKLKIDISEEIGTVSALLVLPDDATSLLVLSHGAGAGMEHAFMESLAQHLASNKVASLRFNFAYMEKGGGPDRPKKAYPAIKAAVKKALKYSDGLTLLAGGKSFGGRMTSQVAALGELDEVKGIVYFGFPLHAPGKVGKERAAHLADIKVPQLFLQGTRDPFAKFELISEVVDGLEKATPVRIEGGNHSFQTLKKLGIPYEDTIEQLAQETAKFASNL